MDNYPEGSDNAQAPWNARCQDAAEGQALRELTGGDADLTCQAFAAFIESSDSDREPVTSKEARPYILGPISNVELLTMMFRSPDFAHCAAACHELKARYLADWLTQQRLHEATQRHLVAA